MMSSHEPGGSGAGVCVVRVGEERFCVDTLAVREILDGREPQPVPLAPAFLCGLVFYRGEVLAVVGLRALLGMAAARSCGSIVVVSCHESNEPFGMMVDEVEEVISVPQGAIEPNPQTLGERRRQICGGVYKLQSGIMARLEPERLQPGRWPELGPGTEGKQHARFNC
jgi:purine-binding chemotaxis protein CheW